MTHLGLRIEPGFVCGGNIRSAGMQEALADLAYAVGVQALGLQALVHHIRVTHIRDRLALQHTIARTCQGAGCENLKPSLPSQAAASRFQQQGRAPEVLALILLDMIIISRRAAL